jgi:hypothetical protein
MCQGTATPNFVLVHTAEGKLLTPVLQTKQFENKTSYKHMRFTLPNIKPNDSPSVQFITNISFGYISECTVKQNTKFTLQYAMKAQTRSRDTALLFP